MNKENEEKLKGMRKYVGEGQWRKKEWEIRINDEGKGCKC